MPRHYETVAGDCLSSVAKANHFRDWRTVYQAPENEALREARPNPNTLLVGDAVNIPDWVDREEACATAQRHPFVARCVRTRVRLKLQTPEPVWVELRIAGTESVRTSVQSEAELTVEVAPDARGGVLYAWLGRDAASVKERTPDAVFDLVFGALPPASTAEGASARLVNLGYASQTDAHGQVAEASILAYQREAGFQQSGAADEATRSGLERDHDR